MAEAGKLAVPKPFSRPGAFHLEQFQSVSAARLDRHMGASTAAGITQARQRLGELLHL